MPQKQAERTRHTGFHRGQTRTFSRELSEEADTRSNARTRTSNATGNGGLTTGSRLKSGIVLTFPEHQEPQSGSEGSERGGLRRSVEATPRRRDGGSSQSTHRGRGADQKPPRRDSSSGEPRPNSGRSHRQPKVSRPDPAAQNGAAGPEQGKAPTGGGGEEGSTLSLTDKMKEMKILQGAEQFTSWLLVTVMRQWEAEKDMAEEQARQAEAQAQALIEERSRIKAEKEQLQRSHNEMAARLQLLEGIISDSDDLDDEQTYLHDDPYPHDREALSAEERFRASVEVLE